MRRAARPRWSSVLAVVKNPADSIPWISIYIIMLGLLAHFGMTLVKWILRESRRREA